MKPLLYPEVTSFAALFEEWTTWNEYKARYPDTRGPLHTYGWLIPLDPRGQGTTWFGPYTACDFRQAGGPWHVGVALRPKQAVIDKLREEWLDVAYDQSHYKFVSHGDGKTLVLIQYNNILGDRWLARVDTDSIPFFTKEA